MNLTVEPVLLVSFAGNNDTATTFSVESSEADPSSSCNGKGRCGKGREGGRESDTHEHSVCYLPSQSIDQSINQSIRAVENHKLLPGVLRHSPRLAVVGSSASTVPDFAIHIIAQLHGRALLCSPDQGRDAFISKAS